MAGSVNKATIIGRLGSDVEIKTMQSGEKLATLSVATSETWKDRDGQKQERTTWHKVVIFNEHLVKVAESYLKKGSLIHLEGALQTRSWEDQNGNKKYVTEIVLQKYRGELTMLDGRSEGQGDQQGRSGSSYQEGGTVHHQKPVGGGEIEDSIPF